ncbi:baseplate J/gp47 family protein [Paenibacillus aurantiacus]|uniref:Baseplate J/gp47 family protein n=1 Tax=Paenibacillus aurantiacus TaxID=1936118 RepID=A0ABV5KP63_9BACL
MAGEILTAMLAAISNTYDKREGSFVFDALAPVAEQLELMELDIAGVSGLMSIENLSGDMLAQRVKERTGINRKVATHAKGFVTVVGTGTINQGDLFETASGIQFRAMETKAVTVSGSIAVEAVAAGATGNVPAAAITMFPVTLAGFTAVTNPEETQDGFDAESDLDLLSRYYEHIRTPVTSGNKAHYLNWAKSIPGVGDARVIPLWAGNNTVKVVIIDSNKGPASEPIVAEAQAYIDPGVTGLGNGAAPIGAIVTVASADALTVNVEANVALVQGYTLDQATTAVIDRLELCLREAAFGETSVSYAKVGATIVGSEGIADYTSLTVNGGTTNLSVGTEEVAVLGTVTLHVA